MKILLPALTVLSLYATAAGQPALPSTPPKQVVVGTPAPVYPRAPGWELAKAKCTVCHGAEQFLNARLDRKAWKNTLDKMHGFGAEITPEEKSLLLDYLSSHLRPDTPRAKAARVRLEPPSP